MPGDPFYATSEWRCFRADVLRDCPMCQVPGCREPSCHVDHIVSRRKGGAAFSRSNVQALCHSHHSSKTARRDMPGRKANMAPLVAHGCDAQGWPIDPRHRWRR